MASLSRKRSLADMRDASQHEEFSVAAYLRDVLQLEEGDTEDAVAKDLAIEAAELGVQIAQPQKEPLPVRDSGLTAETEHVRTSSTGSRASVSTGLTVPASFEEVASSRRFSQRSLSFSEYDKYLAHTETSCSFEPVTLKPAPSIFSVSGHRSYAGIKAGIKNRFKLHRRRIPPKTLRSCVCCRDEFSSKQGLYSLLCSHRYCIKCIRTLVQQAFTDEFHMPPKCCNRAIPSTMITTVLSYDEQQTFLNAVIQFSTPWESRVFCPLPSCGAFIPPRTKVDPRHPFTLVCPRCQTAVCATCKREVHEVGQDCPADWELDAVLRLGESSGWRRCYKCRTLVELAQGCSHITCRCKAQFCYICGAVWDREIGCPNYCSGEEELERRRAEEEERAKLQAEEDAAKEAELARTEAALTAALKRSEDSAELTSLRQMQIGERERFIDFDKKAKWTMWTRHGQAKLDILDKYSELQSKMMDRHAKTSSHLEDRQVEAEMDLRASLKQSERSVQIRLRHMEAYCHGRGRDVAFQGSRDVTERDLRELEQQYNLRNNLQRMQEAKINVLREQQAKQMDQLLTRQNEEMEKLGMKRDEDLVALEEEFELEEEKSHALSAARKERLRLRWSTQHEIGRQKLIRATGLEFARLKDVDFDSPVQCTDGLDTVQE